MGRANLKFTGSRSTDITRLHHGVIASTGAKKLILRELPSGGNIIISGFLCYLVGRWWWVRGVGGGSVIKATICSLFRGHF
jgi:hypothetical protein